MDSEQRYHTIVTAAAWQELSDLLTPAGERRPSLMDLKTLVLTGGAGDTTRRPIKFTLFEWSDHIGSDIDAANAIALGDDNELVRVTSGPDGGKATVTVGDHPGDMEEQKRDVHRLRASLEWLRNDHPLIDDQTHSDYITTLAESAWKEWLGADVWTDLIRYLPPPYRPGDAPLTPRFRDDPRPREDIVRDVYLSGPVEWCAETAVTVSNLRHADCAAHVVSVVYGITPGTGRG